MKYIRYILLNGIFLIILFLIIFFSFKEIKLNQYMEENKNEENKNEENKNEENKNEENKKWSDSKIKFEEQKTNKEVVETINSENESRGLTREEKLAKALKTGVEDDIWFWGNYSTYYEYVNETMEYEYDFKVYRPYQFSDSFEEKAHVFLTKTNSPYQSDEIETFYYLLGVPLNKGEFTNEVSLCFGLQDYDELKKKIPAPEGSGIIEIEEIRKPTYDISEERMQESAAKIMNYFNEHNNLNKTYSTVYIRYFYESSENTIIIYSNSEEQFFANVEVNGGTIYKPTPVNDEVLEEYVRKLIECSYLVKQ